MVQNLQKDEAENSLNYFVCTLGQAADINASHPHTYKTILSFLLHQRKHARDKPAVGFPVVPRHSKNDERWGWKTFTFEELAIQSFISSKYLSCYLDKHSHSSTFETKVRTVALLCPSSEEFLFIWLGLILMGYSVLLIAPQCQPSAIAHLCDVCESTYLLYDACYTELAQEAAQVSWATLDLLPLDPSDRESIRDCPNIGKPELDRSDSLENVIQVIENQTRDTDTAYLHHTSGTSTGLPKPIPQSHRAAIGVLPRMIGQDQATFTTTPLYHGGIADCFRAWTSDAMIWLFPGKEAPITASNVLKCIDCADRCARARKTPPVRYFSSVPYVLQMVAVEEEGLEVLRSMGIVGVGGAALPQVTGDDLAKKGVNLVSRFGSAECGFLMSSHRKYTNDKEWQYLRSDKGSKSLSFEPQEGGLAELVILPQWPHMAKRNRADGSLATADLFAAHPEIPNAWKYHSRADSQLTLVTGKKFDPAPLEAAIATSPLLSEVLIFGNGQQYPGALLFRSTDAANMTADDLLDRLWPDIEKLNAESQDHTRIARSMLVIMPVGTLSLEKSSKGTILRAQAEKRYAAQIEEAYDGGSSADTDSLSLSAVPDDKVAKEISKIIKHVMSNTKQISDDTDFFSIGVDSVACIQIRAMLQKHLFAAESPVLPLNVVYDCGTIERLSEHIIDTRKGKVPEYEDETQLMRDLVTTYGNFGSLDPSLRQNMISKSHDHGSLVGQIVILTGATGSLGAHLLDQLRSDPSVAEVVCLIRASSHDAARGRINNSLGQRGKSSLQGNLKISFLITDLGAPQLGLSHEAYFDLVSKATMIIHAAWAVNFSMRLRSFVKDHIKGLRNLLILALSSPHTLPPAFLFCSSTASVTATPLSRRGDSKISNSVSEVTSLDPHTASPLGYSRSKWVAESICSQAYQTTRMRDRITILRIGQLCGDTASGIWNVTEAWPLMLSSVQVTGSLPDLGNGEALGWLPVDLAGKAICEVGNWMGSTEKEQMVGQGDDEKTDIRQDRGCPVYHIVNNDRTVTWNNLLRWLTEFARRPFFKIVAPSEWITQLDNLTGEDAKHPSRKLLGLWKSAYGKSNVEGDSGQEVPTVTFELDETVKVAPTMRNVKPISSEQFQRIWEWIEREMMSG